MVEDNGRRRAAVAATVWLRALLVVFSGLLVALALAGPADACTRIGFCGKPRLCREMPDGSLVCTSDPDPKPTALAYPIAMPFSLSQRPASRR